MKIFLLIVCLLLIFIIALLLHDWIEYTNALTVYAKQIKVYDKSLSATVAKSDEMQKEIVRLSSENSRLKEENNLLVEWRDNLLRMENDSSEGEKINEQ